MNRSSSPSRLEQPTSDSSAAAISSRGERSSWAVVPAVMAPTGTWMRARINRAASPGLPCAARPRPPRSRLRRGSDRSGRQVERQLIEGECPCRGLDLDLVQRDDARQRGDAADEFAELVVTAREADLDRQLGVEVLLAPRAPAGTASPAGRRRGRSARCRPAGSAPRSCRAAGAAARRTSARCRPAAVRRPRG